MKESRGKVEERKVEGGGGEGERHPFITLWSSSLYA